MPLTRKTARITGPSLALACAVLASLHAAPAWANPKAEADHLRTRALAATCAQCHGTDGRAVAGEAMVRLAGLPETYILEQLTAFRIGQRPATIMHQITRGYSQQQLEALSKYFAAQK